MNKPAIIRLDTWEKFDAWCDGLMSKPTHTPDDLIKASDELGFTETINDEVA